MKVKTMAVQQRVDVWDEVVEFLVSSPAPEQTIALRASDTMQMRVHYLLDKSREDRLTDEEHRDLEELSRLNHFAIRLKARAQHKLNKRSVPIK